MADEMHRLQVGQPYNPARTRWPESPHLVLNEHDVELVLFYAKPTEHEVAAVNTAPARFALVSGEHALMLSYQLGQFVPWSDAPWQACRQTVAPPGLPVVPEGMHLPVILVLVDADTGIIAAMRMTSWPARFANAVRRAIQTQLDNGSDDAAGGAEIEAWQRRYPSTVDLVKQRAEIEVRGGSPNTATTMN